MIVIIDTKEKRPWRFPRWVFTRAGSLDTGDYTLAGGEDYVRIERKSLADLANCISGDERARFKRELERLRNFPVRTVIVEGTIEDVLEHKYHSRVHPNALIGSVRAWEDRYVVPFRFAGSAEGAMWSALALLQSCERDISKASRTSAAASVCTSSSLVPALPMTVA